MQLNQLKEANLVALSLHCHELVEGGRHYLAGIASSATDMAANVYNKSSAFIKEHTPTFVTVPSLPLA